jgi:pimeloyl-ACP methyl ester carboxylesterase
MTLDEWRRAAKSFVFEGHRLAYWDEGRGETLLCIHGFPTASWDWHRLWPGLTARFRTLALDMLGFGFSDKPRRHRYSIHEQATLHEALMASLDVPRAHLLAHDYGDSVAQELLARELERRESGGRGALIVSCCFLNGGLFPEMHRARRIQKLLDSPLGALLARLSNERGFRRSFSAVFGPRTQPNDAELRDFWALCAHQDGMRIAHRLIRYMRDRRQHRERWVGALQRTAVPLRFVNGPEDPVSGRHMAARWRELVPRGELVLLEGIGHYPQVEDPERTLHALREFWDRL